MKTIIYENATNVDKKVTITHNSSDGHDTGCRYTKIVKPKGVIRDDREVTGIESETWEADNCQ